MVQQRREPRFLIPSCYLTHGPARLAHRARRCVRDALCCPCSPRPVPFPPPPPQPLPRPCSAASQVLRDRLTSRARTSQAYRLSVPWAARPAINMGGRARDLPVLAQEDSVHAQVLRPRGVRQQLALALLTMLPSASWDSVGTPKW